MIYFDENMPKHLAKGFEILQYPEGLKKGCKIEVKYIPEEFDYGVKDVEWIPILGGQGACVITQDININRRKHEMELYRKHGLGVFFLRGPSKKQGLSVWQMLEALSRNWTDITEIALKEKRPFAYLFKTLGSIKKLKF